MKKALIFSLVLTSIYNIYKIKTFNQTKNNNLYHSHQHLIKVNKINKVKRLSIQPKTTTDNLSFSPLPAESNTRNTPSQYQYIKSSIRSKTKELSKNELTLQLKQIHDMQWTSLYLIPSIMGKELISLDTFNKYLKIKKSYKENQENSDELFYKYLKSKYGYAEVMDDELDWNNFKEELHSKFLSQIQLIFEPEAYHSYQGILNKYISDTENKVMKIADIKYTMEWTPI